MILKSVHIPRNERVIMGRICQVCSDKTIFTAEYLMLAQYVKHFVVVHNTNESSTE